MKYRNHIEGGDYVPYAFSKLLIREKLKRDEKGVKDLGKHLINASF